MSTSESWEVSSHTRRCTSCIRSLVLFGLALQRTDNIGACALGNDLKVLDSTVVPGVSHVEKCDRLVKNMADWRLEVDLKKLNDRLMTCHSMTGGDGIMTTSASEMQMRRIGLATGNQSALFMMSINNVDIMLNVCCIQFTVQLVGNLQVCN